MLVSLSQGRYSCSIHGQDPAREHGLQRGKVPTGGAPTQRQRLPPPAHPQSGAQPSFYLFNSINLTL